MNIRGIVGGNSEVYLVEKDKELILGKAKEAAFELVKGEAE